MAVPMRILMRWILATILVSIPAGWLFWHWRYESGMTLRMLSYESFHGQLLAKPTPEMWSYILYVVMAVACLNLGSLMIVWLLGTVFPNRTAK